MIAVQSTHRDSLVRPPSGATRLGGNANTSWQAFAAGDRLRAVQFHPELTRAIAETLMRSRGQLQCGRLAASDHGRRILHNWIDAWVDPQ